MGLTAYYKLRDALTNNEDEANQKLGNILWEELVMMALAGIIEHMKELDCSQFKRECPYCGNDLKKVPVRWCEHNKNIEGIYKHCSICYPEK